MGHSTSESSQNVYFRIFPLWTGVVCIGMGWLCLSGVYLSNYAKPYELWLGNIFVLLGVATIICSLWKFEMHIAPSYYWLLVPLLLFGLLMPRPYSLGPLIIAAGLVLFMLSNHDPLISRVTPGLLLSGLIISMDSLIVPLWYYIGCHERGLPFLASLLARIFTFLGTPCTANGYTLVAQIESDYRIIQVTVDAFGLLPGLFILMGIALCWSFRYDNDERYKWAKLLGIWGLYLFVRYVVLVWIFLAWPDWANVSLMWNPLPGLISFLPLAVVLTFIHRKWLLTGHALLSWPGWPRSIQKGIALVLCATIACIFSTALTDPGKVKKSIGRLLIDEGHSRWEDTKRAFDTTWYGRDSTYTYYSMVQFLENYYKVTMNAAPITPEVLKHQEIVMLKCPTRAYTDEEIEALVSFVNNGGGLFLVGDHTDVYGFSTFLNPLAKRFGLEFNKDSQHDMLGSLSRYKQPLTLGHPVGKYTHELLFATGCTLRAPIWAEKPIIGYGMITREANYANRNFFSDMSHDEDRKSGLFIQIAGVYKGKGRVLCFTDSTIWSNFCVFLQGKPELLLDCLAWLNRSNTIWASIKPYLFFLPLILLSAAIITCPSAATLRDNHPWLISLFLTIIIISIYSVDAIHRFNYKKPCAAKVYPKIAFDMEHSDIFLDNYEMSLPQDPEKLSPLYNAFFLAVQRLGIVPQVRYSFLDSIQAQDSSMVIINPHKKFTQREVDSFLSFIVRGGRALILDSSERYSTSYAWQLLEKLGMEIQYYNPIDRELRLARLRQYPYYGQEHSDNQLYLFSKAKDTLKSVAFQTQDLGEIKGGEPLLWYTSTTSGEDQDQKKGNWSSEPQLQSFKDQASKNQASKEWKSCLSKISFGQGMVTVCTLSKAFSQTGLGYSGAIPSKEQENIYTIVFQILQDLASGPPAKITKMK